MVAQFIVQVNTEPDFEPARVLFTGTGRQYLCHSLQAYQAFRHERDSSVHLTNSPATAMSYATKRSKFHKDTPVVLVVDTKKMDGEILFYGMYRTECLSMGSFIPCEFLLDEEGCPPEHAYRELLALEQQIIALSEAEVRTFVGRYLTDSARYGKSRAGSFPNGSIDGLL
jgi:hypothetical protein